MSIEFMQQHMSIEDVRIDSLRLLCEGKSIVRVSKIFVAHMSR